MIKSKLAAAVMAALAFGYTTAHAQQAPASGSDSQSSGSDDASQKKAKKLDQVTVTGSLIPQSQIETAQPTVTITAQDMKARGFATVADALQQASFATGAVQGAQDTNSFTPGAQTLSMFGLPVGFTKYLIDGRPMGNFPGLYNGSDAFNNISGIPMDMVDHIDILPGGQSSLYGSDAVAGVINIVLKKKIDAPVLDLRYGWDSDGGGANRRISFADSFKVGNFTSLIGVQYESVQPIWRRDRSLTSQYYTQGATPAVASRDALVTTVASNDPTAHVGYQMLDPNQCAGIKGLWNGTEGLQYRKGSGNYCGSFDTPGAGTLSNDKKNGNFYTHNTFDINENVQLYGDLLYNYQETKYVNGASTTWWGTTVNDAGGKSYFWDPNLNGGSLTLVQRSFAPEEVGGYKNIMDKETENSYMVTFGAKGTFGQSNWDYDFGFTHSDDKIIDRAFQRLAGPMEQYFSNKVMGKQHGTYSGYPVYEPNYAALYSPISPSDFRSFTGYSTSHAKTWDNLLRGQLTDGSLFSLPGGDAGVAFVVEGGNEGWDSTPDPRLLQTVTLPDGQTGDYFWGTSAVPGAGHRSRYAGTAELRLPLLQQLTMDISGRYDGYAIDGNNLHHGTYNIGLEYRPFDSLLLRARYGTAFKVPTIADTDQGVSTNYGYVADYLNCARLGFSPSQVANCPARYNDVQFQGTTYGQPGLKPITATNWSYGFVWAPMERMSVSVDYLHWDINNEVTPQSADQLSQQEYLCDTGALDPKSPSCVAAFSQVTRGNNGRNGLLGDITSIVQPKINTANETVNALTANFSYGHGIGSFGSLVWAASYSDVLKHTSQAYPGDATLNVLTNPYYFTDFKSKANASVTWAKDEWSATLYANRYGSTPNYAAQHNNSYEVATAGKLPPWILWNASVTFNPMKNLGLSLMVNNVFNKMPPVDHTFPGTTYMPYNQDNYNVYGRAIYLEANYKFGAP
ncbi:TonB-dependent receptor domain-containing protein [Dyella sp. 20L07]|uniref:TonB-dependent receptor domain-containing protein n=1 Tax=Dyella sp. 20L07 TaxID=3384240 RepID=UPI003D2DCB4F